MIAEKKKVEAELANAQKKVESLTNENANVKKKNHEIECKLLKVMMAENIQKPEKVDVETKHESSIDVATDNGQQPAFGQIKCKKSENDDVIVASETSTKSREVKSDNFKQQKWNENEN
ncbi:uncharacterized protein LOC124453930 [Xenia sp. Carnegie-2017]|uniref:uncharacterized protein LOC124453930 n=1 Tax=Xenia sp. Carnegie-2017 TaxID=2897299 RepID=UPI001F03CD6F|nr:uncharacterized protein LOC124453930 [Xenia sp. Carnegie-2017]